MTAPPGFIVVPTEVGPIVIGVSQIASIQRGGTRGQQAHVRMGNGEVFWVTTNVDAVLDLIDEALDEEPLPLPVATPPVVEKPTTPPVVAKLYGLTAIDASAQQTEIKRETKRRGRPPKNKSQ
jgi:hypothetical protein